VSIVPARSARGHTTIPLDDRDTDPRRSAPLVIAEPAVPVAPPSKPPHSTPTVRERVRKSAQAARVARAIAGVGPFAKGLVRAVRYVFFQARDSIQKKSAIARLKKENTAEQSRLDAVLGLLGREAHRAQLESAPLKDELRATRALEDDRKAAESRIADLGRERDQAEQAFRTIEAEKQAALSASHEALATLEEEHKNRTGERAGNREATGRLQGQVKSLAKRLQSKEAAANRTTDPAQAGALRGEIDALRAQVLALEPELAALGAKAEVLDPPIAKLEAGLAELRKENERLRRDLDTATRAHGEKMAQITGQVDSERKRIARLERELSLRFVTLGTVLNLHRVMTPALEPLYKEADEHRRMITEREQKMTAFEAEMDRYDRPLFHKGLAILALLGVLILTVIVLVLR
jgi:chromosome segregation ATPase